MLLSKQRICFALDSIVKLASPAVRHFLNRFAAQCTLIDNA